MRFHSVHDASVQAPAKTLIGYLSDDKKVSVRVGSQGESAHLEIYLNNCRDKAALLKVAQWLQANLPWFAQCGIKAWVVRGVSDIGSESLEQASDVFKVCSQIESSGVCHSAIGILQGAASVSQAKFCYVGGENVAKNTALRALLKDKSVDRRLSALLFTASLLDNNLNPLLDGLCMQSSFDALAIAPEIAVLVFNQQSLSVERYTGVSLARVYFDSADIARLVFKRLTRMLDFMALPTQYPVGGRLFNKPRQSGVQYLAALDHHNAQDSERFQTLLGGMIRSAEQFTDPERAADTLLRSMQAGKKSCKNSTWGVRATRSQAFETLLADLELMQSLRPAAAVVCNTA